MLVRALLMRARQCKLHDFAFIALEMAFNYNEVRLVSRWCGAGKWRALKLKCPFEVPLRADLLTGGSCRLGH